MKINYLALFTALALSICACDNNGKNPIDDYSQYNDSISNQLYADLEQQKPDSHNVSEYNDLILKYTNDIAIMSYQLDSLIKLLHVASIPGDEYRTYLSHVAHYLGNSCRIDSAVKTLRHLYFSVPSENWSQSYIDYHWNFEMTLLKIKDSDCDSAKYFGNVLLQTITRDSTKLRLEELKTAESIIDLVHSECPD